jgi:hypothetical protein
MRLRGRYGYRARPEVSLSKQNPPRKPLHENARAGERRAMATVSTTHGQLAEAEHSVQLRKAVIASTIGTAIEWYDFFLYGTAAGLVFGKLYFPNEDPYSGTLLAFGTYFIGFGVLQRHKERRATRDRKRCRKAA